MENLIQQKIQELEQLRHNLLQNIRCSDEPARAYQQMSLEDFRRARVLEAYDVTPEWVLHHLCQHEAEHRDEIIALREGAQKSLGLE